MKSNTRSSRIPLPPEELELVLALQTKLKARSKVEVVRRGLQLPKEMTAGRRLSAGVTRDPSVGLEGFEEVLALSKRIS